jgi:hypothetical protein
MDFVIAIGLLECHAPPQRSEEKSAEALAAHRLGKHANLTAGWAGAGWIAGEMPTEARIGENA